MSFKRENSTTLVADEDLFLNADGNKVVREGDPAAATLLARKGDPIPTKVVERLKLDENSKTAEVVKKTEEKQPEKTEPLKTVAPDDIANRQIRPLSKPSIR